MKQKNLYYRFYALLSSTPFNDNMDKISKYLIFLEEKASPYASPQSKKLRKDTPPKIKKGYQNYTTKTHTVFENLKKLLSDHNISKESFREYDNCPRSNDITINAKLFINMIYNFDSDDFYATFKKSTEELKGLFTTIGFLRRRLNDELFVKNGL